MVEQRRANFERMSHAHVIDLDEMSSSKRCL
jgi:hypothetical protein